MEGEEKRRMKRVMQDMGILCFWENWIKGEC